MWGGASVLKALDSVLSLKERKKKKKKKKKRKKKSRPEVACQIPDHHELTLYHRSIPLAQSCVVWSRAVDNFCTGCPRTNLHNIASRCNYHKNSAEEQLLDIHQTVNFSGRPCICLISSLFFFSPCLPWPDEFDAYIIVSFVNATLVLSIGETVEEVTDSGFLGTTPTLSCSLLGDDALVQVMESCFWHVHICLPVATCCTTVLSTVVHHMSCQKVWIGRELHLILPFSISLVKVDQLKMLWAPSKCTQEFFTVFQRQNTSSWPVALS